VGQTWLPQLSGKLIIFLEANIKTILMSKKALLEAILFTTEKPLSAEEIAKVMKIKKESVEKMLLEIKDKYNTEEHGFTLTETGGYKLSVKGDYASKVSHLTPHADLSRGLLRVLSIIAYHEPINQSEIVKVVGNRTYEYVKDLESRGLIKSEKKSRTKILSTTQRFEEYFGAKKESIKKLAENRLEERKETDQSSSLEREN
jgi:segregation and condensation protein B